MRETSCGIETGRNRRKALPSAQGARDDSRAVTPSTSTKAGTIARLVADKRRPLCSDCGSPGSRCHRQVSAVQPLASKAPESSNRRSERDGRSVSFRAPNLGRYMSVLGRERHYDALASRRSIRSSFRLAPQIRERRLWRFRHSARTSTYVCCTLKPVVAAAIFLMPE